MIEPVQDKEDPENDQQYDFYHGVLQDKNPRSYRSIDLHEARIAGGRGDMDVVSRAPKDQDGL
jgi:hypothetical protein